MKEVILGISARCEHASINEITKRCAICEWEALLKNKKLPFKVRYLGTNELTQDAIYTVVGVITDGSIEKGPIPGLLLEGEHGLIARKTYEPTMFSLRLETTR